MSKKGNHRTARRSRMLHFFTLCLVTLLSAGLVLAQAGKKPLNDKEVLDLLQGGVSSARIAELANRQGVKISLTLATERRLRAAGADDGLIATLQKLTEPPRPGTVTIETNPGECDVYVDDEPSGTTSPKGRLRLPAVVAGNHQLRVTRKGFRTSEQEFHVAQGETKSIIVALSLAGGAPTATTDAVVEPGSLEPTRGLGMPGKQSTEKTGGLPHGQNAVKRPTFETESYKVVIQSVRKSGTNVFISLLFESLSNQKIPLSWGAFGYTTDRGPYLLDENGDKWVLAAEDDAGIVWKPGYGAVDLLPGTKIKTRFVFTGQGPASTFSLFCSEGAPQSGRDIVVHRLTAE